LTFVVIDGLDASGKSTQGSKLAENLRRKKNTVLLRIHPSDDNLFGTMTRRFLYESGTSAHFASAFFYMLDVVRSILLYSWRKYDFIIFVRYLMGTAYLPSPLHRLAYLFFASTVPTSEFMFFLDVSPEEAEKRLRQTRRNFEMFENLGQLRVIRKKAVLLASTGKWRIINAEKSKREIEKHLVAALTA